MAVVHEDAEHRIEIVYYGVGLSGKTTNLQYIYAQTPPERRSAMRSHATETERRLRFSMLPVSLPPLGGRRAGGRARADAESGRRPSFEAVASSGQGVFDTLKACVRSVLAS